MKSIFFGFKGRKPCMKIFGDVGAGLAPALLR